MPPRPKVQSTAVVVGLTIVTLGIYSLVWYYRVNREMRDLGRALGDSELADSRPGRSVWAMVAGSLFVIPTIVTMGNAVHRLGRCERLTGTDPGGVAAIVACVIAASVANVGTLLVAGPASVGLTLVAVVTWCTAIGVLQRRLNALWRREPLPWAALERPEDLLAAA